jgi:hypothetical protein
LLGCSHSPIVRHRSEWFRGEVMKQTPNFKKKLFQTEWPLIVLEVHITSSSIEKAFAAAVTSFL